MPTPTTSAFTGAVPEGYHRNLRELLFEPCATDLIARLDLARTKPLRILELACGTGIVTRHLLKALPPGASVTATDLNDAMLDVARRHVGPDPRVKFQTVDACDPPFAGAAFDLILCQFGVMFFPDKPRAMRHARRILAPGGRYLFNVWDSFEHNPIPGVAHHTVARMFPANPPAFFATPYGYYDRAEIEKTVRAGGFTRVSLDEVTFPCSSPSAEDAAAGLIDGSPLSGELQSRGVTDTGPIRRAVAETLAARFGARPCRATMREIVVSAS